jgi:hypothetical protein
LTSRFTPTWDILNPSANGDHEIGHFLAEAMKNVGNQGAITVDEALCSGLPGNPENRYHLRRFGSHPGHPG